MHHALNLQARRAADDDVGRVGRERSGVAVGADRQNVAPIGKDNALRSALLRRGCVDAEKRNGDDAPVTVRPVEWTMRALTFVASENDAVSGWTTTVQLECSRWHGHETSRTPRCGSVKDPSAFSAHVRPHSPSAVHIATSSSPGACTSACPSHESRLVIFRCFARHRRWLATGTPFTVNVSTVRVSRVSFCPVVKRASDVGCFPPLVSAGATSGTSGVTG